MRLIFLTICKKNKFIDDDFQIGLKVEIQSHVSL
jgi:hypothetical protein